MSVRHTRYRIYNHYQFRNLHRNGEITSSMWLPFFLLYTSSKFSKTQFRRFFHRFLTLETEVKKNIIFSKNGIIKNKNNLNILKSIFILVRQAMRAHYKYINGTSIVHKICAPGPKLSSGPTNQPEISFYLTKHV